jgi:hypothetical protein
VPAEQVGDRVLGEAQPVVHAEPVGRRALRVVEVQLLADPGQERPETGRKVLAGLYDPLALDGVE